jgi:hypothetical protein
MRIACLLYGQPRDYMGGYSHIMAFIKQNNIEVDFFYHAWILDSQSRYDTCPWANAQPAHLEYKDDIKTHLEKLYRPKRCEYELQRTDWIIDTDSLIYKNTKTSDNQRVVRNNISQVYTRTKVCSIVKEFIQDTGAEYDAAIMTRFDLQQNISIILKDHDLTKVIVGRMHLPRKIFPDHFIIAPIPVMLKWFSLYDTLPLLQNSLEVCNKIRAYGEQFCFISENMIFAKYLYDFDSVDNVLYLF